METSLRNCLAIVLFAACSLGVSACANRGMELVVDGSGGTGGLTGTGGQAPGTGGSVPGGNGGAGSGGAAGSRGSGGSTGGVSGSGGQVTGSGGASGGTAGASSRGGSTGSGGAAGGPGGGTGGAAGGGGRGAGGAAGRGGTGGVAGNGGAGGGNGQVIVSIDFIGGSVPTGGASGGTLVAAPEMTATEIAGVKPAANWNGAATIAGTLANLRQSDGSVTSATVTWNSPSISGNPGEWTNGYADAPGDTRMMNGYLDPTSSTSPATVKVSGLPAAIAGRYDVYVYVYGYVSIGSTRTYQYAIGGTTFTVSQAGPSPSTFPGFTLAPPGGAGSYVVFRDVSGTAFTLTATPGTGVQTRAPINGIQIVWPPGS